MPSSINFDFQRAERIGLSEAVFCHGKTPTQIEQAVELARRAGVSLLLTRLATEQFDQLAARYQTSIDYDRVSRTGIFGRWRQPLTDPAVAVVTAGTSDLPVAREASRTLAYYGVASHEIVDVGVAGLWRVLAHEEELRRFPAVIVVAGMEGALFSVVGGLVGGVVIAVPTSNGYGVARGGVTALHAALASCAPGVVVVNVDNGYGAACAARRVLNAAASSPPSDR